MSDGHDQEQGGWKEFKATIRDGEVVGAEVDGEEADEQELPTAAEVTDVGMNPSDGVAVQNFVQLTEGDELVTKSNAVVYGAQEKYRGRKQGIELGKDRTRRRFKELIDSVEKTMQSIAIDTSMESMAETFAEELREEVEQE